jgi:ABC-2 type transport system ATP-binding protein
MPESPVLQTCAVTKRFGDLLAVDQVDLEARAGTVHGLLGRNGAGKTTLMRMILGLLAPDSGSVRILGHQAQPGEVESRRAVAGFVEEPRFYPYLSAQRNLELLAQLNGRPGGGAVGEALELVGLAGCGRQKAGNFSTGMRQRLGIAAALLREARLMVLDEPTIGLDPENARAVRELLADLAGRGVAVLLSSHNMAEVAELCQQVTIIRDGATVWEGTQAQLHEAAPTPAYRIRTSDDESAAAIANRMAMQPQTSARVSGLDVLTVSGSEAQRDAFVRELIQAGVDLRLLEPDVPPLEALFSFLAGPDSQAKAAA